MSFEQLFKDKNKNIRKKSPDDEMESQKRETRETAEADHSGLMALQSQVGNMAVQRLLAQRKGDEEPYEVDNNISEKINQKRGSGQTLDSGMQEKMGAATGYDFSNVNVHTDSEAQNLSQSVQAQAFTTGNDVFFNEGKYNPGSSSGQELIAHELTHVVQQNAGDVDLGGSGMTVNAPNDQYEQEADAVAKEVTTPGGEAVQAKMLQRQDDTEEESMQQKPLQREEEEDLLQEKPLQREEEEDLLQEKPLQREEEEDLLQEKPLQREEEEDLLQEKPLQRVEEEEEQLQTKSIQREAEEEECIDC